MQMHISLKLGKARYSVVFVLSYFIDCVILCWAIVLCSYQCENTLGYVSNY